MPRYVPTIQRWWVEWSAHYSTEAGPVEAKGALIVDPEGRLVGNNIFFENKVNLSNCWSAGLSIVIIHASYM